MRKNNNYELVHGRKERQEEKKTNNEFRGTKTKR